MSSPNTHNQGPHSNALEVMRRISNATRGKKSIFRGESKISPHPCSSSLYRQLKKENATKGSILNLLKQRQNKLIERIRRHTEDGNSDLERLMAFQHRGGKTNLIDFAGDKLIALFFACFWNDDEDGQIIVKRRNTFPETIDELPDNKVVLLKPQKALLRAKDQRAVLIHAPVGFLPFETEESIVVKAEWKQEILEYLENEHDILYETVFDDMQGAVDEQNREDEQRVAMKFQSTTRIRGFAKPKDNKNIPTMEHYLRLLKGPVKGLYKELLSEHAAILITHFTEELKQNPIDAVIYFNRALVHHSKPDPNYGQAISDYGRALELNPSLVGVYNNRGAAYASKPSPDYKRAIADYDRAIKLKPDYAGAYSNRGILYAEKPQPDYDKAISDYTHAIGLNPNFAMAYYNRGNAYAIKPSPDYKRAIADYDRAIKLKPDYAKAYLNRSLTYNRRPNPDFVQAAWDHCRALELNPDLVGSDYDSENQQFLGLAASIDYPLLRLLKPLLNFRVKRSMKPTKD